MKKLLWDPNFCPSYTPKEMLDLGIFEGIYTFAIEGAPNEIKNHKNVLKRGDEPNIEINQFKVKSRQSLKEWKRKGWTTKHSPLGWWQWYVLYFYKRRIPEEDTLQIKRWRSFVARHQAQVTKQCRKGDHSCHSKQRQGLLQWAWDSDTPFNEDQLEKNLKRIVTLTKTELATVSNEMFSSLW